MVYTGSRKGDIRKLDTRCKNGTSHLYKYTGGFPLVDSLLACDDRFTLVSSHLDGRVRI